ncbi:FAD-dependent oxidoreductase [Chloroflexota bacterium]
MDCLYLIVKTTKDFGQECIIREERLNVDRNIIKTDVLILGGGITGCFAAIKAREKRLNVTLVDKAMKKSMGYTFVS